MIQPRILSNTHHMPHEAANSIDESFFGDGSASHLDEEAAFKSCEESLVVIGVVFSVSTRSDGVKEP